MNVCTQLNEASGTYLLFIAHYMPFCFVFSFYTHSHALVASFLLYTRTQAHAKRTKKAHKQSPHDTYKKRKRHAHTHTHIVYYTLNDAERRIDDGWSLKREKCKLLPNKNFKYPPLFMRRLVASI